MQRVLLLILLALALPTAALADSITTVTIPFSCPVSGNCKIGSFFGPPNNFRRLTQPFTLDLIGTTAGSEVVVGGLQLNPNPCGPTGTCMFTGGTIAVTVAGTTQNFPIVSGSFTFSGDRVATDFEANLEHGGSFSITALSWNGDGHLAVASGSITVNEPSTVIPEPGTLLTFGTGVIALAGMMRRKLKLGT